MSTEPLVAAIVTGDAAAVRTLLGAGADVHARDEAGASPLHVAARFRRAAIVRALLEAGGSPLELDAEGRRPIDVLFGPLPPADPPPGGVGEQREIFGRLVAAEADARAGGAAAAARAPAASHVPSPIGPPSDPAQLPELEGDSLTFVWAPHATLPLYVITSGPAVLWAEPVTPGDPSRFVAAARLLQARYPGRKLWLSGRTEELEGGSWSVASGIRAVVHALLHGDEIPSVDPAPVAPRAEPEPPPPGDRRLGFSELANLVVADELEQIRAYLIGGGAPHRFDDDGETLLHVASRHGRLRIATTLLAWGAPPAARNRSGRRPVDVAGAPAPGEAPCEGREIAGVTRADERRELTGALVNAEAEARAHGEDGGDTAPAAESSVPPRIGRPRGPDDLPELEGDELHFTWDRHPDLPLHVVRHGERVLWTETLVLDNGEPFEVAARLLRDRYGLRARDLEPSPEALGAFLSGPLEAWQALERARGELQRGEPVRGTLTWRRYVRRRATDRPYRATPVGELPLTMIGIHPPGIRRVALSPDGAALAVAHPSGIDVTWPGSGRTAAWGGTLLGLPSSTRLARIWRGKLEVRDLAGGEVVHETNMSDARSVALSPDGSLLALMFDDLIEEAYNSWPVTPRWCCRTDDGHIVWRSDRYDLVNAPNARQVLAFGADSEAIFAVQADGVMIWSVVDGRGLHAARVWPAGARADWRAILESPVVVAGSGLILDSAVTGDGLELLDPRSFRRIRLLRAKDRQIRPRAVSPDGAYAISVTIHGEPETQLWELEQDRYRVLQVPPDAGAVTSATFEPTGGGFVLGTQEGAVLRGDLPRRPTAAPVVAGAATGL